MPLHPQSYLLIPFRARLAIYGTTAAMFRTLKMMLRSSKMQHWVGEAKRHGEEIEEMVDKWFKSVDKATLAASKILQGNDTANKKCFMGLCPNLKMRYQFSRKAKREQEVVAQRVLSVTRRRGPWIPRTIISPRQNMTLSWKNCQTRNFLKSAQQSLCHYAKLVSFLKCLNCQMSPHFIC